MTATTPPAGEPGLDKLYETRNVLQDKWPMLARVGAWMFVVVFAFVWLLVNFVNLKVLPLRVHIQANVARSPHTWWVGLGASIGTGLFVALWAILVLAFFVRVFAFLVYGDRLRVCLGRLKWDIQFQDITAVEPVSFAPWPRPGAFWQDLKLQVRTVFLTPRYRQVGYGQTLRSRTTWVLVKVRGRRWWRGYFFDVDNPNEFFETLNQALARYRAIEGQAQLHSTV